MKQNRGNSGTLKEKEEHTNTHRHADTRCHGSSVRHHHSKSQSSSPVIINLWEIKWAKMIGLCLFMLPCPVMLDNSSRPIQRTDAVVLFFFRKGFWTQPLLHTAGFWPVLFLFHRGSSKVGALKVYCAGEVQQPRAFLSFSVDVNECDEDPCEGKGRCINSYGSYTCHCHSGYSQVITQNRKFCQGETQPQSAAGDIKFPMETKHRKSSSVSAVHFKSILP